MNRYISLIFSKLVSLLHILVMSGLALAAFAYYSDDSRNFRILVSSLGIPRDAFAFVLAGCFIVYVLIVGFLSTIISINTNLEKINDRVEKLSDTLNSYTSRS